jgi:hypothetical protein
MKHFLISATAVAAIAISAPIWAQPAPSTGAQPGASAPAPVQPMNRMPAGGRATSERGATGSVTRAHHRRHTVQSARNSSAGDAADQLNREELSQLQSGNSAPMNPGANPTTTNRMSVGGRPTSGGPTQ